MTNKLSKIVTSEMKIMDALEKIFGKTAQTIVLKNLIEQQNEQTYFSRIAEETGLSNSSVSRVIKPLVESGIVLERPLGKQMKICQLNKGNEATKLILDFYTKINQTLN
jgi:predicted transcriptional regulator